MAYESSHGISSSKCPNCGKFAIFDYDNMKAYPSGAYRGATSRFRQMITITE